MNTFCRLLALLIAAGISVAPIQAQEADKEQPAIKEIYQDFRANRPFLPEFRKMGRDFDDFAKAEPEGLRITLPGTLPKPRWVEVGSAFIISGDFEITATYELLTAEKATKGYGVALNVSNTNAREKVAWVGRMVRPNEGSIYVSEWQNKPIKGFQSNKRATSAKNGQLRLVREGHKITASASEAPGQEFIKIDEYVNFGTDDLERLRFQVVTGAKEGFAVDARLVDLRVRYAGVRNEKAIAPLAPPEPIAVALEANEAFPDRTGWLALALVVGFAFTLLIAGACALVLVVYRRRVGGTQSKPAGAGR